MSASKAFPGLPEHWLEHFESIQNGNTSLRILHRQSPLHRRALFVVHGFAEHSGRYLHWPHYLQSSVDAVILLDLPGHGKSKGPRGWIKDFSDYNESAKQSCLFTADWLQKKWGAVELYWHGHSMGGLITLGTTTQTDGLPIKAVSVSSPLLDVAIKVPVIKGAFAKLIEPVLGKLPLGNELDVKNFTKDVSVVEAHTVDKDIVHVITPHLFIEMFKAMELVRTQYLEISYPFHMMTPMDDMVVSTKAELEYYPKLKVKKGKKKLSTFPGVRHEPFNDLEKALVFNCLDNWITENSSL